MVMKTVCGDVLESNDSLTQTPFHHDVLDPVPSTGADPQQTTEMKVVKVMWIHRYRH